MLQHTRDISAVLQEMSRVTLPDGKIVVFEPDWETFVIWPGDRDVMRKVLNFWCDHIPNGWAGRSVPAAFVEAGIDNITLTTLCLVITSLPLAGRVFDLDTPLSLAVKAGVLDPGDWNPGPEEWHRLEMPAGSSVRLHFILLRGQKRAESGFSLRIPVSPLMLKFIQLT